MICKFCSGPIFAEDNKTTVGENAFVHDACLPFIRDVKWEYKKEIHEHEQVDSGREVRDRDSVLQDDDAVVHMEPDEHLSGDDGK